MSIKKISQQVKKKIPLFYKIAIFLSLIVFTILFYFVVLVSAQPRSIPLITNQIQLYLDKHFANKIKIKETSIGFTKYGTLKIGLFGLQILQESSSSSFFGKVNSKKKFLLIPKAETELALFDLIQLKINISKLTINKPEFIINLQQLQNDSGSNQFLATFYQLFAHNQPIKQIEIINGTITVINNNNLYRFWRLNSNLHLNFKNNQVVLINKTDLSLDANKSSFYLDSLCVLENHLNIKCESKIKNLNTNHLLKFFPNLNLVNQINGLVYGKTSLVYNQENKFSLEGDLNIDYGNFTQQNLFSESLNFRNFNTKFAINLLDQSLIFYNLETELIKKIPNTEQNTNPKIKAKINIIKQNNNIYQSIFNLDCTDFATDELSIFWPLLLNQNQLRTWFLKHFQGGKINAKTNFSLLHNSNNVDLQNIDAFIDFDKINLDYHYDFPPIKNASGFAIITKKNMVINVEKANILESQIMKAKVSIPDFLNSKNVLQISGNIEGDASDLLKPINKINNSIVKKYLNGKALSELFLELPLYKEKFDLSDVVLTANTIAYQIKNQFLEGETKIKIDKPLNSKTFNINLNLDKAKLIVNNLSLNKQFGEKADLNFAIAVENYINIHNVKLNTAFGKKKLNGEMQFTYQPFFIHNLYFSNQNSAKQNYTFFYKQNNSSAPKIIKLTGKYFNVSNFLNNNAEFFKDLKSEKQNELQISISLQQLELFNKKSLYNVVANANCLLWYCDYLNIKAEELNNKNITIKTENNQKNDNQIKIKIEDIAYLADAFIASNHLAEGGVMIDIKQRKSADGINLSGNLINIGNIGVFDNEKIQNLANDPLKSQIKNKIFQNNKTNFNNIKITFDLIKTIVTINSFLANNLIIGITAKGNINLINQETQLKGLLIPGYVVNNLFGLGKIPVLGEIFKGLLIGNDGGGVFGIKYQYVKNKSYPQGKLEVNKISAFVPTSIQNLFD
jgi:hypothetical protein